MPCTKMAVGDITPAQPEKVMKGQSTYKHRWSAGEPASGPNVNRSRQTHKITSTR